MVIVSENDFIGLIREAIERNQSVDFSGKEVLLSAPVRIQRKDCLHIIGGTIRGSDYTHSLFILNSRKELPEGARCLHLEVTLNAFLLLGVCGSVPKCLSTTTAPLTVSHPLLVLPRHRSTRVRRCTTAPCRRT